MKALGNKWQYQLCQLSQTLQLHRVQMFMNFLSGLSVKHLANSHWLQNDIIIKMLPFLFFSGFFSVSQVGAALMGNTTCDIDNASQR